MMPQEYDRQAREQQPLARGCGDVSLSIRILRDTYASDIFKNSYGIREYWQAVGRALLYRERNRMSSAMDLAKAALNTHQLR